MPDDERAIRELIQTWLAATQKGDVQTILGLMADDVVFMLPGQSPFGKEAFAASFKALTGVRFETSSEINEIKLLGDWAYLRNYLDVTMTPPAACLFAGRAIRSRSCARSQTGAGWSRATPIFWRRRRDGG